MLLTVISAPKVHSVVIGLNWCSWITNRHLEKWKGYWNVWGWKLRFIMQKKTYMSDFPILYM